MAEAIENALSGLEKKASAPVEPETPKTSDSSMIAVYGIAILMSALVLLLALKRKKEMN